MTSRQNCAFARAITLLLALTLPGAACAATLNGRVVSVQGGDTITVIDASKTQHKIRLAGIYAPQPKQPFGDKSKQNLSEMIYNKPVKVEWTKRDKNKRIVGKVLFTPAVCVSPQCVQSADANREQIATGFAWHDKEYAVEQATDDRKSYVAAEKQAREAKRGLWADEKPVPPWEWRRKK